MSNLRTGSLAAGMPRRGCPASAELVVEQVPAFVGDSLRLLDRGPEARGLAPRCLRAPSRSVDARSAHAPRRTGVTDPNLQVINRSWTHTAREPTCQR